MRILTLNRFYTDKATIGKINIDNHTFFTIESLWENNKVNVSCIPEGEYRIYPHQSPKFGNTYILFGGSVGYSVSDTVTRTHCLIHTGNYVQDVNGCIVLGLKLEFHSVPMVTQSKVAIELFKDLLTYKEAKLIIKGV